MKSVFITVKRSATPVRYTKAVRHIVTFDKKMAPGFFDVHDVFIGIVMGYLSGEFPEAAEVGDNARCLSRYCLHRES